MNKQIAFPQYSQTWQNPMNNVVKSFFLITRGIIVLSILLFLIPTYANAQTRRYVKSTATSGNGTSWATASPDLQQMINEVAAAGGGQVWVAAGTYIPNRNAASGSISANHPDNSFVMKKGVSIYGGFKGTETTLSQRELNSSEMFVYKSILNGNNISHHVVIFAGDLGTAVFDGFYVTGGVGGKTGSDGMITVNGEGSIQRAHGAGIYIRNVPKVFILNSVIHSNKMATDATGIGGGLYYLNALNNADASASIANVVIQDNVSYSGGGAFFSSVNTNKGILLRKVRIAWNKAMSAGGGIQINDGAKIITNQVNISNNEAGYNGGGILLAGNNIGDCQFTNILIHSNKVIGSNGTGGGIYINTGDYTFTNVTLTNNEAPTDKGNGLYIANQTGTASAVLRNTIIWNNGGTTESGNIYNARGSNGSLIHQNNLVQGMKLGSGIVSNTDPLFSNTNPSDDAAFKLTLGSPATNGGNNSLYELGGGNLQTDGDLAREPRLSSCAIDIGAYELQIPLNADNNRVVYVTPNGAGNKDGSSWANAFPGLAMPLRMAQGICVDEIWVARGTYYPEYAADGISTDNRDKSFVVPEGVKIYGGFAGNESSIAQRNIAANPSVLSGANTNSYHVLIAINRVNNTQTVVDGFTITDGNANGNGSLLVYNNDVPRNVGGGVCVITNDETTVQVSLLNNTIKNNTAAISGGGIYSLSNKGIISLNNNTIINNTVNATSGALAGGMYIQSNTGGQIFSVNNLIANNSVVSQQAKGGGIYVSGTDNSESVVLVNNTIAQNTVSGLLPAGGGLALEQGKARLYNSIIWGNNINGVNDDLWATTGLQVKNSLVGVSQISLDQTNESGDPLFENAADGNFYLQKCSPAINAGDNNLYIGSIYTSKDNGGYTRLIESTIDMGAYEYQQLNGTAQKIKLLSGNNIQNINFGDPITPINYVCGGSSTNINFVTTPSNAGLYASFFQNIIDITGEPIISGDINYTVTTTGSSNCPSASLTGKITVDGGVTFVKTVDDSTGCINQTRTFKLSLTNNESVTKHDFEIYDSLSAGWNFVRATATLGVTDYSSGKLEWGIISLAPGQTAELTLEATPIQSGVLSNTAWIMVIGGVAAKHYETKVDVVVVQDETCISVTDDYATALSGESTTVNILANDNLGGCSLDPFYNVKVPVSVGVASEARIGEEMEKSFDGDMSTIYHSEWTTQFPVTLEYFFTNANRIDYLKYYPRPAPNPNGNFKEIEVWVKTGTQTEYSKYGDYNFNGSNEYSQVDFTEGLYNPTAIKIVVNSGVNYYASCAEMEFYKKEAFRIIDGPYLGEAYSNNNGSLEYISDKEKWGIDSLDYGVDCQETAVSARVYIAVLKKLAQQYIACQGAELTIGVETIADVEFDWYSNLQATTLVAGNTDKITVTKDNTSLQTYYVKAKWRGIEFPVYSVDVLLSQYCGEVNPTDCAVYGTLLWKESFDNYDNGLNPASLAYSRESLPVGMTTYAYTNVPGKISGGVTGIYTSGSYALVKDAFDAANPTSYLKSYRDDHTSLGDNSIGRFLITNGRTQPDRVYVQRINDLCPGSILNFSFWMAGHDGEIEWTVYAEPSNEVITKFSLPKLPSSNNNQWKYYGFPIVLPEGVSSIRFEIFNSATVASGNDVVYDDIEVRLCVSPVNVTLSANDLCAGDNLTFNGSFNDVNGTMGSELVYHWLFKKDNNSEWIIIEDEVSDNPVNAHLAISGIQQANSGYYKLVVGNAATINLNNCRASSDSIHIKVLPNSVTPDIRIQFCSEPSRIIKLSSYIDTIGINFITWDKTFIINPDFIAGTESTTGSVNSSDFKEGTYTYQYTVKGTCTDGSAKLFMTVNRNNLTTLQPDTVIICYENAERLQINQIMGVEAGGSIVFDPYSAADQAYITENSYGGINYNGKEAYTALGTNETFNGNAVRIVKFKYIPKEGSCMTTDGKSIMLILTPFQ